MSEDKEVKQWKEKLFYRPKNGYDLIDAEQTGEIFAYAEGYKRFLDAAAHRARGRQGGDPHGGGRGLCAVYVRYGAAAGCKGVCE